MHLAFSSDVTTLSTNDGGVVTLGPSPKALAAACFRHEPPTARELEHAIDVVEDALMAAKPPRGGEEALTTFEPVLRLLPGLETPGSAVSRDAVEQLFQQLVSIASGSPSPIGTEVADREAAAALLITRECMHHLDFAWIRVERAS
jgi:hypothetical protein